MAYVEYPNGGAVFSTSSIAWSGSLSFNDYDNNVSRLTENVLRRFASDEPLPGLASAPSEGGAGDGGAGGSGAGGSAAGGAGAAGGGR